MKKMEVGRKEMRRICVWGWWGDDRDGRMDVEIRRVGIWRMEAGR